MNKCNSKCGLLKKLILLAGVAAFIAFVTAVIVKAVKILKEERCSCDFDDDIFGTCGFDDDDECECGHCDETAESTDGYAGEQDFEQN